MMNSQKIRSCLCFKWHALHVLPVVFLAIGLPAGAQTGLELLPDAGQTVSSVSLGAGSVASLDTYLSPSEYTGVYLSGDFDRTHQIASDAVFPYRQFYFHIGVGSMRNHAGTMSAETAMIHCYGSWLHKFVDNGIWQSLLGFSSLTDLGGVLNSANSNNPFNVKFQMSAGATFDNMLNFKIGKRPMVFRGTLFLPLMGIGFAPDNDEFYFDMASRGNLSGDFHFVSPFNAQTASVRLALAVPVCSQVVQLGYNMYLMHNRLGDNFSGLMHSYATVGLVHRFERLKWR